MKRLLIAIVALSLIINVPQKANAIVPIVLLLSGLFTLITLPLVVVAGKKPKRVVEKISEIETVRGMETGKAGNETPTYTQNEPAEELDEENRKTPLKKKKEKTVSEPTYLRNEPAEELDEENRKTPLKKKKEDPTSRPQGTTGRRQGLSEERMLELKLLFERLDVDNTRDVQFCKQIASLFKAEIASRKATRDQEENVLALYYGRICNRIKELSQIKAASATPTPRHTQPPQTKAASATPTPRHTQPPQTKAASATPTPRHTRPQGTTGRRQGLSEERMLELKLLFERLDVDNTRDVQFCKQIASLFKAEIASRKATRDQEENVLALYYGRICNRIKELLEEEQQGEEKKQGEEEKQETPQNFSESYWMQFLKFLFKFL